MKSSWDETKQSCNYHFDNTRMDPRWDNVIGLGQFSGEWQQELAEAIAAAKPATWATRGYKAEGVDIPRPDLVAEEYDLERIGMDKDAVITNLTWDLAPVFQRMADSFKLIDPMVRLHVQHPGQVWNLHMDKLQKWCPDDPSSVIRIFIQLTDWQPGHFWAFGNYTYSKWAAGDIVTMDWENTPHCTANAGHTSRATLQVTGVRSSLTDKFLTTLKNVEAYAV